MTREEAKMKTKTTFSKQVKYFLLLLNAFLYSSISEPQPIHEHIVLR